MEMNETGIETEKLIEIDYGNSLTGNVSPELEQAIKNLYTKCLRNKDMHKRSEKAFLKEVSAWEKEGRCTISDLCVILGWFLGGSDDTSWKKVKDIFSLEQLEKIALPEWVENGEETPQYDDEALFLSNGGSGGSDEENRGW